MESPTKSPHPIDLAKSVEGTVTFEPHPDTVYRYKVLASHDKLRIWLENYKTKEQWKTTDLEMKDFLREGLVIPLATFRDYVQCFLTCLEAVPSSTSFSRELVPSATINDAMEFRLTLQVRALDTTWSPTYTFVLRSVPLALVDVLEAKVRDQADEISCLHKKVEELSTQPTLGLFARGTLAKQANIGETLVWTPLETSGACDGLLEFATDGSIRFTRGGVFVVSGLLKCSGNAGSLVELYLQNKAILTLHVEHSSSPYWQTLPLHHVLTIQPGDELQLANRGGNHVGVPSSITIYIHHRLASLLIPSSSNVSIC